MIRVTVIKRTRTTPLYNIGVVSRLTGLPVYTLRWIGQHGLICPHRTGGNQRLFSDEDVALLEQIRDLMRQRVNLPGIRVILRMRTGSSVSGHRGKIRPRA